MSNLELQASPHPSTPRKARKRNVTSRDRLGCVTCLPIQCTKANRTCGGYARGISFRDQTMMVIERVQKPESRRARKGSASGSFTRSPIPQELSRSPCQSIEPLADLDIIENLPQPDQVSVPTLTIDTPVGEDFLFETWGLLGDPWPQDTGNQLCIMPQLPSSPQQAFQGDFGGIGALEPEDACALVQTSLLQTSIPDSLSLGPSLPYDCFLFSQDSEYCQRLFDNQIRGLSAVLPLKDIFNGDYSAAPHVWSAVLAVSALTLSIETSPGLITPAMATQKKHALRHYANSLRSLRIKHPQNTPEAFSSLPLQELLDWFLCRLLLANFELGRGNLTLWRAHLRATSRVFSAWHKRIRGVPRGRILAQVFARMALLVELQNEELAVTGIKDMNPGVAHELSTMIQGSMSARDRLLGFIREVGQLELKFRCTPSMFAKWTGKLETLDARLTEWQRCLSPLEMPVDTGVDDPVSFPAQVGDPDPLQVHPLTFPNAADSTAAAVNYAHFICTRMRARTRYLENGTKIPPSNANSMALYICRIAAGLSPNSCAVTEAFGHGMMPAVVGAYWWTTDPQLRRWIVNWLQGYDKNGQREGIWNVRQARKLMMFLDGEILQRRTRAEHWNVIAARVKEREESFPTGQNDILEAELEMSSEDEDQGEGSLEFRVVVHSQSESGWATNYYTIV
ncbi:hypothetical protein B0J15DRAFT_441273 [Fusarium solani]|uniref:Uncharacterized protein n=2 Tax=Fusarium solani TaxID=169388 RepID=A0A9P9R7M3_FUSSL|nr:uncharacterized protein B0J15DRAFT_441273 [Fusarium solani]KAH7268105.1 hypothetical protein B0J15DRAFT_441273 [Fusarium solani]